MCNKSIEEYQDLIEEALNSDLGKSNSYWDETDKMFGAILLDIVVNKRNSPKLKRISLEELKIEKQYFKFDYLGDLQEIAKMRGRPSYNPKEMAGGMLADFFTKNEVRIHSKDIYKLNTSGVLYKILENILCVSKTT